MKNLSNFCKILVVNLGFGLALAAADETVSGNLTVTGDTTVNGGLGVGGDIDALGDNFTLGTSAGLETVYSSSATEGVTWRMNRAADWLWETDVSSTLTPLMRLDANGHLSVYFGGTAGVTLNPQTKSLSLGDATLYRDSAGVLKTDGAMVVAGQFDALSYNATSGVIEGGATGLELKAGGTNQNVVISPSGTGNTVLKGNVGIGTSSPASKLDVQVSGGPGIVPNIASIGHESGGQFKFTADSAGANYLHTRWVTYDPVAARWEWSTTTTVGASLLHMGVNNSDEFGIDVKNFGSVAAGDPVNFVRAFTVREDEVIVPNELTVGSDVNVGGEFSAGNLNFLVETTGHTFSKGSIGSGNLLYLEGTTIDAFEAKITTIDPTGSDNVHTLPNKSGTFAHLFDLPSLATLGLAASDSVSFANVTATSGLQIQNAGDAQLTITADSDNVGENDNPSLLLQQDGNGVNGLVGLTGDINHLFSGAAYNSTFIEAKGGTDPGFGAIQFVTGGTTPGGTDGTARVTITSGGNVGIGTTAPSQALQIVGTAIAGDNVSGATGGSFGFGIPYTGNNILNTIGSQFSSAATTVGYGVKPKAGQTGYVSSADNSSFKRGALELTDNFVFRNAASETIVVGADVPMTERFRITGTGHVGIGTASPTVALDVAGEVNVGGDSLYVGGSGHRNLELDGRMGRFIASGNSGGWSWTGLQFKGSGGTVGGGIYGNGIDDNLESIRVSFGSAYPDTPVMGWTSTHARVYAAAESTSKYTGALLVDGGVGIGGNLNVGGTFSAGNFNAGSAGSSNQRIQVSGSNSGTSIISSVDQAATVFLTNKNGGANTFADLIYQDASGNGVAGIAGVFVNDTTNQGDLAFTTRNSGSNLSEKMRILGNGNVGIGTNSPDARFHVYKQMQTGVGLVDLVTFGDDGWSAAGQEGDGIRLLLGSDDRGSGIASISEGNAAWGKKQRLAFYSYLHSEHGGSGIQEQMTISSNGHVGIGMMSPTEALDVVGNGNFSGTISAANFSGSSLGTNTGDQILPTRVSLGVGILDAPAFSSLTATSGYMYAGSTSGTRLGDDTQATLYRPSGNISIYSDAGDVLLNRTGASDVLVGTSTNSANGRIQLKTHTSPFGGIGFGTDVSLYRKTFDTLKTDDDFIVGSTTDSTSSTTGALTAHSAGIADDVYVGDLVVADNVYARSTGNAVSSGPGGAAFQAQGAQDQTSALILRQSNVVNWRVENQATTGDFRIHDGINAFFDYDKSAQTLALRDNVTVQGSISATNISGTNTGDQTFSLTGDLTGSGTGSIATTIDASIARDAEVTAAVAAHASNTNNPHSVTAAQVGLGNVNDTSDASKPISTVTQTALDAKQPLDSDLIAIAALNTTPAGRALLDDVDAAAQRETIGLGASATARFNRINIGDTDPGGDFIIRRQNRVLNLIVNQKLEGTWPATPELGTATIQSSGSSSGSIAFATGNNERMRIAASGNVGIGTSSPTETFEVAGTVKVSGATRFDGPVRITPQGDLLMGAFTNEP